MTEYREYIDVTPDETYKYKVYVFTFIAKGKQRYYVGETKESIEERARSHLRYKGKSILHNGKIQKVETEEIEPISFRVIDSARSKNRARYKERKKYIEIGANIKDKEMVCGGH
jgi:hypothetical protein